MHNAVLASILAEWQSGNSYGTRIAHIEGTQSGGLNGTNDLIFGSTVKGDGAANKLTGGKGTQDKITDHHAGEQIN